VWMAGRAIKKGKQGQKGSFVVTKLTKHLPTHACPDKGRKMSLLPEY
jgi:hypothetical protein